MEEIKIRKIEKKDLPSVVKLHIETWKNTYKNIIKKSYLDSLDYTKMLEKREKDYLENGFIVAVKGEEIVGFCRYRTKIENSFEISEADCELSAIYIKVEEKRQGIGRKLLKFVLEEMEKENREKMVIWCLRDNLDARKFYEQMGGIQDKNRTLKIGDVDYEEVSYIYKLKEGGKRNEQSN